MRSATPVCLTVLGKEYRIACPEGEDASLQQASQYLIDKINEIRLSGKVIGAERIAVMAALNIAHELLIERQHQEENKKTLVDRIDSTRRQIQAITPNISPDTSST